MLSTPRVVVAMSTLALSLAAPAAAMASTGHGHGHSGAGHGHHGHGHGVTKGHHGHHGGSGGSVRDRFTAVGSVVSVDTSAGTLTMQDKGGTKALHGTTVVVSVPATASITVDDQTATLDQVAASDHVVVKGTGAATASYTATKVVASSGDGSSADSTDGTDGSSADSTDGTEGSSADSTDGTEDGTSDGASSTDGP